MTDPIDSIHIQNPYEWAIKASIKEHTLGAEETVASLYYQSSISSLASVKPETDQAALKIENTETKKSFLGRTKDWLWGIFGWGQQQPVSELESDDASIDDEADEDVLSGGPKLSEPEYKYQKRLSQSITDINRDLVNHLKEIAEFEEEMRKSSSGKLDKLLFMSLVDSSLRQKQLNHSRSLLAHEDLLDLHKKNKELHKAHFALMDSIDSENRTRGVLKWVNIGLTTMTVGGTAIAFASGGSALAIGMPIALLGKAGTMIFDGILKYKADGKTGDLIVIKQETKANAANERENLTQMQNLDGEIATLLKKIRQILDNQTKAERASFGRN